MPRFAGTNWPFGGSPKREGRRCWRQSLNLERTASLPSVLSRLHWRGFRRGRSVRFGEDLAYWTNALRFAARLVIRGQFLPDLKAEDRGYAARWTPVFAGIEAARLHALAKGMPPAARALTWEDGGKRPDAAAETVLTSFVRFIVDGLVRSSASGAKLPAVESIHDRWMAALTDEDGAMRGDAG